MVNIVYDPTALNLQVYKLEGDECVCTCINPAHQDTHPSSYFNMKTGLFYCHSCGFSANVKEICNITGGYISQIESSSLSSDFTDMENDWQNFLNCPLAMNNPYLMQRKVTNELINEYHILEKPNKIIVPLYNSFKDPVGVLIRHIKAKTMKYQILGEKTFWPRYKWHEYDTHFPVIVTEGVFGALNALKYGLQAFALLGATNIPEFYGNEKFALIGAFDDDEAGYLASINLLTLNLEAKAVYPGVEADEIDYVVWQDIADGHLITDDIQQYKNKFAKNKYKLNVNQRRLNRMLYPKPYKKYKAKRK